MNIVSLLYNKIQILTFKSSLFGQKQIHTATVTIPAEEARNFNLDHYALQLKKAIEGLPEKISPKKIKLILGQQFWRYLRVELPPDIQATAQEQYLKEQLNQKIGPEAATGYLKYFISDYKGKQFACVYLLTQKTLADIQTLLSFYDLKIEEIYPEALLVFTLFSHTLNKQKEEAALFLEYESGESSGLLFDSVGLIQESVIILETKKITDELKEFKKGQSLAIARLILGGPLAHEIRQDNFTKESGIWTNPLEKVLQNSDLKQMADKLHLEKELLPYNREISLLNLVLNKESRSLALFLKARTQAPGINLNLKPKKKLSLGWIVKPVLLILVTSFLTFGIIKLGGWGMAAIKLRVTPTPTPKPVKAKVTPTPKITVARSSVTVEILNGSGTAGLAGSLETELEDLGYKIESVGNAENFDYTKTLIIAPSKAVYNLLSRDLVKFKVAKSDFEQTNSETVTVIIGQDFAL